MVRILVHNWFIIVPSLIIVGYWQILGKGHPPSLLLLLSLSSPKRPILNKINDMPLRFFASSNFKSLQITSNHFKIMNIFCIAVFHSKYLSEETQSQYLVLIHSSSEVCSSDLSEEVPSSLLINLIICSLPQNIYTLLKILVDNRFYLS